MAQREGSVYLYLFIVAMMLFVLVTVGFVMKVQDYDDAVIKRNRACLLYTSPSPRDRG